MFKKVLFLAAALVLLLPSAAAALSDEELLLLVTMPLVVSEVLQIEDVPAEPLFDLIALLNEADVPPGEFIEIVRHVPVVLVEEREVDRPVIVELVSTQVQQGVRGTALAAAIHELLRSRGVPAGPKLIVNVNAPRITEVELVPEVIRVRVKEKRPRGATPAPAAIVVEKVRGEDDTDHEDSDEETEERKRGKRGKGKGRDKS